MISKEAIQKLKDACAAVTCGCALERLQSAQPDDGIEWSNLRQVAKVLLGFSEEEAEGVMDGWDIVAGKRGCFKGNYYGEYGYGPLKDVTSTMLAEYESGRELGRVLACDYLRTEW